MGDFKIYRSPVSALSSYTHSTITAQYRLYKAYRTVVRGSKIRQDGRATSEEVSGTCSIMRSVNDGVVVVLTPPSTRPIMSKSTTSASMLDD